MNSLERIKEHIKGTDLADKLSTLKEEDYENMMEHITDKAKKEAVDGVACIEDNDVFGWAYEFIANYDGKSVESEENQCENAKTLQNEQEKSLKHQNSSYFTKKEPKKKTVIEHVEDGTKVKQADLFGWEK